MLTENFSSIELGDAAAYAPYFRALPLHAADYTFTNLWGWGTHYNLEWRTAHGLCWIRQKRNDLPVERLWAPVGDWYAADWAAMPELVPGTTILRAPEPLCELLLERLPGRVAIEETPGQWEYLYTQEALSTLAGNKLHKKKNHVNGYMKAYGEDYRALNGEIMPQVLALQDDWCKWRECEKSAAGRKRCGLFRAPQLGRLARAYRRRALCRRGNGRLRRRRTARRSDHRSPL